MVIVVVVVAAAAIDSVAVHMVAIGDVVIAITIAVSLQDRSDHNLSVDVLDQNLRTLLQRILFQPRGQ